MEAVILNIDPSQVPDTVIKLSSLQEKLNQSIVTATEHIDKPPICFEVKNGEFSAEIGTLGNLSLWIGKAKQGKTFAVSMALAAAETCDWLQDKIKISLPEDQKTVLHFDTEQSRYHVQRVVKRIAKLANMAEPMNITAFGLRKYSAAERVEMIEYAVYNTENLGFVVIDGIRDLITSINDEEQSSMIVSKLMKWSEELNIHIAVVLHTNKADNNARGHVGTELTNKSESVISISKDDSDQELMVVKAEFCRNRTFDEFGFTIDEFGIPKISESKIISKQAGKKSLTPVDIDGSVHIEILDAIFKIEPRITYKNLQNQVKDYFMRHGIRFGENKAVEFITYYLNNEVVVKVEGQSKYPFYTRTLNHFKVL